MVPWVVASGMFISQLDSTILITSLPLILRPLAEWRDVVNGALLIVVAVLLPAGIFGVFSLFRRRDALADSGAEVDADVPAAPKAGR